MKSLTPGQQRRLEEVIDGMGWDGRTIEGGRFVRVLDPDGRRGVGAHVEAAVVNLSTEPSAQMLNEFFPNAGVVLQDDPFEIDASTPFVILSDTAIGGAENSPVDIVQRVTDRRRIVSLHSAGESLLERSNPFDFKTQLSAASVGPDVPGGLFVVRVHQVVNAQLREQIVMLLANDENDAASAGARAFVAQRPLAVEVFKPKWNPPMHGLLIMQIAHRRRLSVDECISYYRLPGPVETGTAPRPE